MKLNELIHNVETLSINHAGNPEIKGLAYDSRYVRAGSMFFALPGTNTDGSNFIQDAISRGAVAIVSQNKLAPLAKTSVATIQVTDSRRTMAELASIFYGNPSEKLCVCGITGTNGKTTTAYMLNNALKIKEENGKMPGLIGTIEYRLGERIIPATRTTPESVDIQNMLNQIVSDGIHNAVMEVSSHSLIQKRVDCIDFDMAIFTNLTQDHLDFHKTMDDYFAAKARFFNQLSRKKKKNVFAVINIDDPYGKKLYELSPSFDAVVVTYGIESQANFKANDVQVNSSGSSFKVESKDGSFAINLKMYGRYNVYNALATFAAASALNVEPSVIVKTLSEIKSVPGRLEKIEHSGSFNVFVDYAHTEDALKNVLTTLREITENRLIVVFGCGGNRDKKKRPLMGKVASQLADYMIVTSDNPRNENPMDIIMQIRAGITDMSRSEVVEDRHEAIIRALSFAEKGDTILIAGKGHENYQEFAHTIIPFDDREVVRECLSVKTK
jgi:UDP-N-acetylmuramoyl-L-alanyl-D-glutamate--2,6-diaminopimelate ligase